MRRRDALTPHPDEARDLAALDAALAGEHNEWSGVVHRARAARPPLRQAFATKLDARIAHGLRPRPSRFAGLLRPRTGFAVAGAMASVALAVVIGVGSASQSKPGGETTAGAFASHAGRSAAAAPTASAAAPTASAAAPTASAAPEEAAVPSTATATGSAGSAGAGATPATPSAKPRKVERSTQLALATPADALTRVSDAIVTTTDRFGGIVDRSDVNADDNGGGSASFDLRVPAARLPQALAALSKLAHVRSRSESSLDITAPTTSVADRLADARAERTSLLRRLARASTANETASVKARLTLVRGRIADLRSQAGVLAQRADDARVTVTLASTGKRVAAAPGPHSWGPGDAWHDALRVLSGAAAVAIVTAVIGAPLALLALIALGSARRRSRRRREAALV